MSTSTLIETVPNLSTGDPRLAAWIAAPLAHPPAVRLVHLTSDDRHGRSVATAIGQPEAVLDALVEVGRRAARSIDLRTHRGVHPRVGVLDVVPLVPLAAGVPALTLAPLARLLAARLAEEAGLACVAYAEADPTGRQLPDLRSGGPEALFARIDAGEVPAWLPSGLTPGDRQRLGACCVGAREILVAYNVLLDTGDVAVARAIARAVRERDGGLPAVRALGLPMSADRTQVSMNLLDVTRTSVLAAFDAVEREAARRQAGVIRSELVGCVPRRAWPDGLSVRVREPEMAAEAGAGRFLDEWLPGGSLADAPGLRPEDRADPPVADAPAAIRLLDLPLGEGRGALESVLAELGERPFRARQVLRAIHARAARGFEAMTELPAWLRSALAGRVRVGLVELAERAASPDGTVKYLWRLPDGAEVESVAIPSPRRLTHCVSSQAGCALRCSFCATGYLGLVRNLTAGEILDQVLAMRADATMHGLPEVEALNVVFMGMGEPGYNMDAVLAACRVLNDPEGGGVGARRLTISTAGVVPAIRRLADEPLQVRLAVSLHAGDQALRESLMNVAARHPLPELLEACRAYQDATGRRITFEYAVIPGINDRPEDARSLARFARQVDSKINLIPYNPVAGYGVRPPSEAEVARFRDAVRASYRGDVMVRQTRGREIEAACGMLHRARHSEAAR